MANEARAQPNLQQYEALKIPAEWTGDERRFASRLIETLDDIYRRYGRFTLNDLGKGLRKWIDGVNGGMLEIIETAEGLVVRVTNAEGDISQVQQTAEAIAARVENTEGDITEILLTTDGIAAAVKNNRLRFSEKGLEIINASGEVVFSQNNATGDLSITGILRALGGVIGGFTIEDGALSAGGTRIVLDALNGRVRLGQLTITDSTTFGPVLQSAAGLSFVVGGQLYWILANGGITAQMPVYAQHGLFATPGDVVNYAPNMWMDPATGKIHRTTGTAEGGGGGQEPDPDPETPTPEAPAAQLSVVPGTPKVWSPMYFNFGASGGTPPYMRYLFRVLHTSGEWVTVYDGTESSFGPFVIQTPGNHTATLTVYDSLGRWSTAPLTFYVAPQ